MLIFSIHQRSVTCSLSLLELHPELPWQTYGQEGLLSWQVDWRLTCCRFGLWLWLPSAPNSPYRPRSERLIFYWNRNCTERTIPRTLRPYQIKSMWLQWLMGIFILKSICCIPIIFYFFLNKMPENLQQMDRLPTKQCVTTVGLCSLAINSILYCWRWLWYVCLLLRGSSSHN